MSKRDHKQTIEACPSVTKIVEVWQSFSTTKPKINCSDLAVLYKLDGKTPVWDSRSGVILAEDGRYPPGTVEIV